MFSFLSYWLLNPLNKNLQRITKADKTIANNPDYRSIKFPVSKNGYSKTEKKNCINVFCYQNYIFYPAHIVKIGLRLYGFIIS